MSLYKHRIKDDMRPKTLWMVLLRLSSAFVFFFQAEDGIRGLTVTGVQTCALPICLRGDAFQVLHLPQRGHFCTGSRPRTLVEAAPAGVACFPLARTRRGEPPGHVEHAEAAHGLRLREQGAVAVTVIRQQVGAAPQGTVVADGVSITQDALDAVQITAYG